MRRLVWAIALVSGLVLPVAAEEVLPALYRVVGVAAGDVLNIRARPDAGAPILGTLAPDATGVEVIAIAGGWASVNGPEQTGYVALRFLMREDLPAWNALQAPLTCFGTEPFWSLAIDPIAGTATMASPEDLDGQVAEISQTWPGAAWAPAAALALPEGMAVLYPAECSDGMSDRSYGIAVDLFLRTQDRPRLSGCCLIDQP